MLGIVLALLSTVASGLSVVLVRRHSAGSNAFNMSVVITIVGMAMLWPLALAEQKLNLINLAGFLLFALSGILSPGIVRLFYYKGLRTLGASGNSAIFSIYPLYSALLAVVLLGEGLGFENWLGIAGIILGVIVIDLTIHGGAAESRTGRNNLIFPILGGLTLAAATIVRKVALDVSDAPVIGVAIAYVFSLIPYALILVSSKPVRRDLSLKREFRWFWVAGIGQATSWLLAFYALSYAQVSITSALLAIEPLFVAIFAFVLLRELERVPLKMVAGIAVTLVGVILVML